MQSIVWLFTASFMVLHFTSRNSIGFPTEAILSAIRNNQLTVDAIHEERMQPISSWFDRDVKICRKPFGGTSVGIYMYKKFNMDISCCQKCMKLNEWHSGFQGGSCEKPPNSNQFKCYCKFKPLVQDKIVDNIGIKTIVFSQSAKIAQDDLEADRKRYEDQIQKLQDKELQSLDLIAREEELLKNKNDHEKTVQEYTESCNLKMKALAGKETELKTMEDQLAIAKSDHEATVEKHETDIKEKIQQLKDREEVLNTEFDKLEESKVNHNRNVEEDDIKVANFQSIYGEQMARLLACQSKLSEDIENLAIKEEAHTNNVKAFQEQEAFNLQKRKDLETEVEKLSRGQLALSEHLMAVLDNREVNTK